jgi:hypothetical protein
VVVSVAVGVAAVMLALGRIAIAFVGGGSDPGDDAGGRAADQGASDDGAGAEGEAGPAGAIDAAAERLESAGTFAYTATFESSFPDDPDPAMRGPLVDHVEGAIELPDRLVERVTPDFGDVAEHVLIGPERWSRWSFLPDELNERPWIPESHDTEALDARSIVGWLTASMDHQDAGTDPEGRRLVRATVPARDLPGSRAGGSLEVALDDDVDPVRISLRTTSESIGLLDEVTYELSAFGEPVDVPRPSADEIDHTPSVHEEDIAAAGVEPIGLAPPPPGWELVGGFVEVVGNGCNLVNLDYNAPEASLQLDVTTNECAIGPAGGEPFQAGGLSGRINRMATGSAGAVFAGDVTVVFTAAELAEPESVLAALGPIDPAEQAFYVP